MKRPRSEKEKPAVKCKKCKYTSKDPHLDVCPECGKKMEKIQYEEKLPQDESLISCLDGKTSVAAFIQSVCADGTSKTSTP